jgi:hypothetical protein
MDPRDAMSIGDVEGREEKRKKEEDRKTKREYKKRQKEVIKAAEALSSKYSKKGHILRSHDALRYYTTIFVTKKMNTYTLTVTYYAPNYELIITSKQGRETRLAFEKIDKLIQQIEFWERH